MSQLSERVSPRTSAALDELEGLIGLIRQAHQRVEQHGGQGCAELNRALTVAEELKLKLASEGGQSKVRWEHVTFTLRYLLDVVKLVCSLINCIFPRRTTIGNWVHNKKASHQRSYVAGGACVRTRRDACIPFTS
jgi:hypothetical protein